MLRVNVRVLPGHVTKLVLPGSGLWGPAGTTVRLTYDPISDGLWVSYVLRDLPSELCHVNLCAELSAAQQFNRQLKT